MNFVTWKLDFSDANYGTGPEEKAALHGVVLSGLISDGEIHTGGRILGSIDGELDLQEFAQWSLQHLTAEEANAFVQEVSPGSHLSENGSIVEP